MGKELGFHLVGTFHFVVLTDVILGVSDCSAVLKARVAFSWSRSGTVTADINTLAQMSLEVVSDVLHARGVVETVLVRIDVYISWVAAIA